MKTLILLRHAEAAAAAGRNDKRRPLTQAGLKSARALGVCVGERLKNTEGRAALLHSDAVRTTQTAMCLAEAAAPKKALPLMPISKLYNANARAILQCACTEGGDARALVIVAHNPGISDICAQLWASCEAGQGARPSFPLSPATGACFMYDIAMWDECESAAPQSCASVFYHEAAI